MFSWDTVDVAVVTTSFAAEKRTICSNRFFIFTQRGITKRELKWIVAQILITSTDAAAENKVMGKGGSRDQMHITKKCNWFLSRKFPFLTGTQIVLKAATQLKQ